MKFTNGLELKTQRLQGYGGPSVTVITLWLGERRLRILKETSEFYAGVAHERLRAEYEPLTAEQVSERFA